MEPFLQYIRAITHELADVNQGLYASVYRAMNINMEDMEDQIDHPLLIHLEILSFLIGAMRDSVTTIEQSDTMSYQIDTHQFNNAINRIITIIQSIYPITITHNYRPKTHRNISINLDSLHWITFLILERITKHVLSRNQHSDPRIKIDIAVQRSIIICTFRVDDGLDPSFMKHDIVSLCQHILQQHDAKLTLNQGNPVLTLSCTGATAHANLP